ncbi:hypothetical protein HAX54_031381, partial [Datura stramonium]|nr:hypothetical protein [Datura stramonium]
MEEKGEKGREAAWRGGFPVRIWPEVGGFHGLVEENGVVRETVVEFLRWWPEKRGKGERGAVRLVSGGCVRVEGKKNGRRELRGEKVAAAWWWEKEEWVFVLGFG